MAQVDLPKDYYLTNFNKMIDFVFQRYRAILDHKQVNFYVRFNQLSNDAKKLLVRFLMRKNDQFRIDKLKYSEIDGHLSAASELVSKQFAYWVDLSCDSHWTSLFNKTEIVSLFAQTSWKKLSRQQINLAVESLFSTQLCPKQTFLKKEILENKCIEEECIEKQSFENDTSDLSFSEIRKNFDDIKIIQVDNRPFDIYRLLFFGNLRQDLTDFVLQDLGLLVFESYSISQESLPFESQQHILAHIQCYELTEEVASIEDWQPELIAELIGKVPLGYTHDPHLNRRRSRIILNLARQLERLRCYQEALTTYRMTEAVPSKERQIRCLEKLGDYDTAFSETERLFRTTSSEEEYQFAEFFLTRLAKKLNCPSSIKRANLPTEKVIALEQKSTSVEVDSILYLNQSGCAYWLENSLFNTLFGLVYWDVLFADSPGAFFNPFQMSPGDIYLPEFVERRRNQINHLHAKISDDARLIEHISQAWEVNYGKACLFTHWGVIDCELIKKAMNVIPGKHIRKICLRILNNPKENSSGMPDLVFFPESGGYQLIEIKGPGDRLQKNQLRWLNFYQKNKIPHQVIRVEWEQKEWIV